MSQFHPEAIAEGSRFSKWQETLDSSLCSERQLRIFLDCDTVSEGGFVIIFLGCTSEVEVCLRASPILHLFAVKGMLPANDSAGTYFLSAPLAFLPFIRPR